MVTGKVAHTAKNGGVGGILKGLQSLRMSSVYVGIPQENTQRRGDTVNNASLMYIHTHGSPLKNIPARPVIEPAVAAEKDKISTEYAKAVQATINGDNANVLKALHRTGIAGQNAARSWFTDPRNNWPPNSPGTIAKKGSSRPLIDTGTLRKSIIYVIRDN